MRKVTKASYGYIKQKKIHYIKKVTLIFCISLAIFLVGFFLNNQSNRNIFTIIAILGALPGAKALVALVLFWPYKSLPVGDYEKVYEAIVENVEDCQAIAKAKQTTVVEEDRINLLSEMVFTSPEKVMNLDFMLVTTHHIYGLLRNPKQDKAYITNYLKEQLKLRKFDYNVKIVDTLDQYERLVKQAVHSMDESDLTEKQIQGMERERQDLMDYITSLIVD